MFNFDPFQQPFQPFNHPAAKNNIFNFDESFLSHLFLNPLQEPNWDSFSNLNSDEVTIKNHCQSVIAGYLNLKETDGWGQGGDSRIGALFVRLVAKKYLKQTKDCLGVNRIVFEQAFKGLQENQYDPKKTRICYDPSVTGWKDHAVARLVGNLSSEYDPSKPNFEILINSARPTADTDFGNPFFISIHNNAKELEDRRRLLASLNMVPAELAHYSFYASYLKKPEEFLKENQERLGPNSTRLLNGLIYLQKVQLNLQKSGNCWMKQPLRCLLVNLYVELLTHRKELSFEQAWGEAKELYKRVQKAVVIPYVTQLLEKAPVTDIMKQSALRELEAAKRR